MGLSNEEQSRFQELLSVVKLLEIEVMQMSSKRLRFGRIDYGEKPINISWNQAFALEDPSKEIPNLRLFRPKYEVVVTLEKEIIFRHKAIFAVLFEITDEEKFETIWAVEAVKKFFLEKQIMKTIWPFLRQQVMDGMNRLDLKAVPLPWIV